jgi:hypothetical protein
LSPLFPPLSFLKHHRRNCLVGVFYEIYINCRTRTRPSMAQQACSQVMSVMGHIGYLPLHVHVPHPINPPSMYNPTCILISSIYTYAVHVLLSLHHLNVSSAMMTADVQPNSSQRCTGKNGGVHRSAKMLCQGK